LAGPPDVSDTSPDTQPPMPRRERVGDLDSIRVALEAKSSLSTAPLFLMLCREGDLSAEAERLVEVARRQGVRVLVESDREMRRMSMGGATDELIALKGPSPEASLDELMSAQGLVFILAGLRYPGNVGFIVRSAEVAGAAGIVLDTDWKGSERTEALRVGMRADRFFPVIETSAEVAIRAARRAGRRIVALETVGDRTLWDSDLVVPTTVIIGGETAGVDGALLESVDDVLRIPTRGFIPSYNVQAAVAMVLGEWLRQDSTRGTTSRSRR
jgi:tRNA G18 (ribose-2'-O)-methylase SpoU